MPLPVEDAAMFEAALKTLGFPELNIEGRLVKLALRKAVALLIYLAEADGPVAREVAAALLWPETDRETARARLRRMLHRIETAFGRTILEAGRMSIQWSPAIRLCVDSQLFESACGREDFEEACRLYRGDFLAGFSLPDCPEFEEWAFYRREALRGRLMHALERLVRLKNAAGEHSAAGAFANRLAALDPYSEVYCRHLIRSLLLAGDRSAAKRHYSLFEQRLRDELGVAPEAKTQALMIAETAAAGPEVTICARGRHSFGISGTRQRGPRHSGHSRLRVLCRARLGAARVPDLYGLADDGWAANPFRSSWNWPIGSSWLRAGPRRHSRGY
jgi:DNA-binding SARP family transcriptional activator